MQFKFIYAIVIATYRRRSHAKMGLIKKQYLFPFKKLEVWQLAVAHSIFINRLILTILKKERLVIAGQLKRSSGSVVANIAKGPVNEQTIHHQ